MMNQLVEGESEDIPIHDCHALQSPMGSVVANEAVKLVNLTDGAFEEVSGEIPHVRLEVLSGESIVEHLDRRMSTHLPLIKHLEGKFTGFAS